MAIGEVNLVVVGKKFSKDLPVKGTLIFVMPNGSELSLDVIDLINNEWYEEIE
jgi:hypothetical protein